MTARLRSAVSSKPKNKEVPSPPQAPVRNLSGLGHDPQLSAYINTVALKRPEVRLIIGCLLL